MANAERVMVPVSSESASSKSEIEDMVNQHLESVATGVNVCKLCGFTAQRPSDVKKHIETHLDGLSYSCQQCGKTFRSKNSLRNHKSTYHR